MGKAPYLAHVRAHLPSQDVSGLKWFEFFLMLEAVSLWFQPEQISHLTILRPRDYIKNLRNLFAFWSPLHFPVEYIAHWMLNHTLRAPPYDAVHTHSHCKGVMLPSVVSSNVVRGAISNSFGNRYSDTDALILVGDFCQPCVNVVFLLVAPIAPRLMALIFRSHEFGHMKRVKPFLPPSIVPCFNEVIPSTLCRDITGRDSNIGIP